MRIGEEITMENHRLLHALFKNQKKFLFLMFFLIFGGIFLLRAFQHKVILAGNQAYYLLSILQIPETYLRGMWIIPPLLGFFCFLLIRHLALQLDFSQKSLFFFLFFLLLTPAFTFSFTTITLQGISLFLFLLGIFLFFHKNKWMHYFSPLLFLAAITVDIFTSVFLILLLFFILLGKKEKRGKALFLLGMLCLVLAISFFFFHPIFLRGPFQEESLMKTIFADLGSGGAGIFLILLAGVGLGACWKQKKLRLSYLLLTVSFFGTLLVERNFLFLALLIVFFAGEGAVYFYERKWEIPEARKFTLFVVTLGILLTFLISFQQQTFANPSQEEVTVFSWMKENIPVSAKILSLPKNSYALQYFAQRLPYLFPHEKNNEKEKISEDIFSSTYISTTFPLLESQNITFIYFTPEMKNNLPAEQGILFLLRNERFKLRFSHQGHEVWEFTPETQQINTK